MYATNTTKKQLLILEFMQFKLYDASSGSNALHDKKTQRLFVTNSFSMWLGLFSF
jgi:hypothetical protein